MLFSDTLEAPLALVMRSPYLSLTSLARRVAVWIYRPELAIAVFIIVIGAADSVRTSIIPSISSTFSPRRLICLFSSCPFIAIATIPPLAKQPMTPSRMAPSVNSSRLAMDDFFFVMAAFGFSLLCFFSTFTPKSLFVLLFKVEKVDGWMSTSHNAFRFQNALSTGCKAALIFPLIAAIFSEQICCASCSMNESPQMSRHSSNENCASVRYSIADWTWLSRALRFCSKAMTTSWSVNILIGICPG